MSTLQFSEGPAPPHAILQRKQLLNHIIDGLAQTRPESVWAKIPRDPSSYEAGYRKITYKLMANAINGMAWWIKREFGESKTFETLAYFGNWDPRYSFLMLAAVKVGYKMIFPSPTYGVLGLLNLLDRVECKTILMSSKGLDVASRLSKDSQRSFYEIPSLTTLLDEEYPRYPFDKTFEDAKSEPLVVVHTSGTTGIPKPLIYSHDWLASWNEQCQASPPKGYTSLESVCFGVELCAMSPPNHSSSFYPNLFAAVPNNIVVLFPLPEAPFNFDTAMAMIRGNDPDLLIAPAFVLDGIASDIKYIKEVSAKIKWIAFGGGPLSIQTGDILTQHFRVFGMYGTSEMGTVPKVIPNGPWDRRGWNSWKPHPTSNFDFRPLPGSDSYETWILKNDNPDEEQPVFKMFPNQKEWSTRDMFSADPHREGFWAYQGRVDDLLILSNGGTVNPSGFEAKVSAAPFVRQAILCGTGKPKTALLVELLDPSLSNDTKCMEELWKVVDECNNLFPPQSSVARTRIIVTPKNKPLPRSPKGTVQRAPALVLYREEIDGVY